MSTAVLVVCLFLLGANAGFITFNYGGRANKLYVPNNYDPSKMPKGYPLFVMLHGCTQDPDTFAKGTKMNDYAEQFGFLVLYPLQPSSKNLNKCWNWFQTVDQARGGGDAAFIAGATNAVLQKYTIDGEAVFVAGLSAGAAMSVIMGATYPDLYTSIAVGAGLEFKAATSTLSAYTAMSSGGPSPKTQGAAAYAAMKAHHKSYPIETLVIHGTSDYTVNQVNGQQVVEQWITTNNIVLGAGKDSGRISSSPTASVNGKVPNGYTYTDFEFTDIETGAVIVHYLKINTMGHAWSGGSTAGSYTDPKGPDASLFMVNWFLQYDKDLVFGFNSTGRY